MIAIFGSQMFNPGPLVRCHTFHRSRFSILHDLALCFMELADTAKKQARWVKHLSLSAPTIAFHASINNSFGKGSLIQLLRQFSVLHSDKKQISVGFIGYPNTGKSSIINTLKKKKVCTVAPIPGETKIWQYITLMRRIYLIDCPGIVPVSAKDSDTDTVLKGVVRVENLATPAEHIPALLERVRPEYLERTYGLERVEGGWHGEEGATVILTAIAKKSGKLLKGGEPDQEAAAKMVLNDWIRGKIPFFVAPPSKPEPGAASAHASSATATATTEAEKKAEEAQEQQELAEEKETKEMLEEQERSLGKVLGIKRVKGVEQPISKIVTMTKFLGDDARRYVEEEEEASVDDEDREMAEEEEEESGEDQEEEELAWDDVFPEEAAGGDAADGEEVVEEEDEDEDDDEEDEDVPSAKQLGKRKGKLFSYHIFFFFFFNNLLMPTQAMDSDEEEQTATKAKRMTTSKQKASNFYTHAVSPAFYHPITLLVLYSNFCPFFLECQEQK